MTLVRPAEFEDSAGIWRLLRQFATSFPPKEESFTASFGLLLEDSKAIFLCIEKEGVLSGYVLAFELVTLFANGSILEILELVVDEPERGKGLGKTLVERVLEIGGRRGCVEAVVPTRRAAGFYEALGFNRTAEYLKRRISGN